jgi:uncharacterized protein (TIGR02246 family)
MRGESAAPDLPVLTQRLADAINARDFDAVARFYADDAAWDARRGVAGVLQGRDTIRGFFEEWFGAYEDVEVVVEEIRDLGHGVTFAVLRQHARLPGATAWVQEAFPVVSTWADGLVQRTTSYTDVDQARAAAERLAEERG